jgi:hypothetical protein
VSLRNQFYGDKEERMKAIVLAAAVGILFAGGTSLGQTTQGSGTAGGAPTTTAPMSPVEPAAPPADTARGSGTTAGSDRDAAATASGNSNQAVATTSANAPAPAKGANSFTMGEARSRIEKNGFSDVSDLAKDDDGIWRGKAQKGGSATSVWLDYKGNVGVAN